MRWKGRLSAVGRAALDLVEVLAAEMRFHEMLWTPAVPDFSV